VTGLEVLDIIGRYAGIGVTTFVASWVGAFFGSYLKKKGENLATHEDIDKLKDQVAAVTTTTKQIEAAISNEMWRRERKAEAQLKTNRCRKHVDDGFSAAGHRRPTLPP
jgi:hypothetical protein